MVNAVCDALSPLGVRHIEMPLKPERVWNAIREAQSAPVQKSSAKMSIRTRRGRRA
jgi:hypothetical protein